MSSQLYYASARLKGYSYKDKVCLDSTSKSCVSDFKYFSFDAQEGMDAPIEGIMGLAQNKQMRLSMEENEVGPLFAYELYLADNIPTPSFSFGYFGYSNEEKSFIDFGEPNERRVEGGIINTSTTIKLSMYDDFFWSTTIQAMRFAEDIAYSFINEAYAILDSGSSHILVPGSLYNQVISQIILAAGEDIDYVIESGYTYVNCTQIDRFKPLEFMFDQYYLPIEPKNYFWDNNGDGEICTLLIMANKYDFFVIGQPIF